MEITEAQWNEMVNKVNGFEAKIEELKTQNAALETKNGEYEAKLAEWQTKLNDQQKTIDSLNQNKGSNETKPKQSTSGHKSVRFDPEQDKYIFE